MGRTFAAVLACLAASAQAASYNVGEVMVVEDTTGAQHDPSQQNPMLGLATTLCQFASKGIYASRSDIYDGVIMFTTNPMAGQELALQNVMRGNIVRQSAQGLSDQPFVQLGGDPASTYGSPSKLGQCVYMGALGQLPANPDDQATTLFGGFFPVGMGITGVELVGHEYGHHWLLWASFDKGDGKGKQYLMRGDEGGSEATQESPNGHWNHYSDARSVMYGSFVTPLGGTNYQLKGGVRKFNQFDQYFMGLRAPSEVSPILIVDDGSGKGAAVQPLWRNATDSVSGTPLMVDVQDVIRSMGPRLPAYPSAQKCFRVAFALVAHQGHTPTAAEVAKVDGYRQRFETWFPFATDGRGFMDTRLSGPSGCVYDTDAGTPAVVDAGRPVDAGIDAGAVDAGTPDAGEQPAPVEATDAGALPPQTQPQPEPPGVDPYDPWNETGKLRPGCGCSGSGGSGGVLLGLLALVALARRRTA